MADWLDRLPADMKAEVLRFRRHGSDVVQEKMEKAPGTPTADLHPRPTGQQMFDAMTKAEQDEQFGPEKAEALRAGEVKLEDLVGTSPQKHGTDFITERSLDELKGD